jgi:hypothetical protein
MSIYSTGLGKDEPLVVSPRRARCMLDCGTTRLYELLAAQELTSYKDGKSRKITVASIEKYITRRIAASQCIEDAAGPCRIRRPT